MDSLCNKMELNKGQSTAEKEVPMIAQMSRKSDIYHRPGCPYISRIHESHIEAFDMGDHKITHFQPCKYCCNMKTMYRKIQPNLPEIFGILVFDTLKIKQVPQPLINAGVVALWTIYMKYSNVLPSLTFFLNSFHFTFCYELIV